VTKTELQISSMVGRRRKLTDGQMIDICSKFASGMKVQKLAKMYNISTHTVYSIVYWTPREAPIHE
jgi:Mor family transcriptional regulator